MSNSVRTGPTLAELGELAVLERLRPYCSPGVGDDAAVQTLASDHQLVTTTDVLVADVHFSDQTTPPHAIGWRSVAVNLSDLAAMGAEPLGITVGLALPGNVPWSWLEAVYQGMTDCLAAFGGEIVGGDLCRSAVATVSITALGQVKPDQLLRRTAAQPGQSILVTGPHGLSRAGLALLQGQEAASVSAALRQQWIAAHQYPQPRFDAIAALQSLEFGCSTAGSAIAGMDSSDGLANAVVQLCRSSGVGAQLEPLAMPPGLVAWVGVDRAQDWVLYGGEDFELVLCLPPVTARALQGHLPGSAIIGQIRANPAQIELAGQPLTLDGNFQHFA
ncbi:MAG: thiamine-phosphate kinase [Cyanobacteria bacterium J06632_22]